MTEVTEPDDTLWVELRTAEPDDRIALAYLLRAAAGSTARDFVMSEQDERTITHLTGFWVLIRAAGSGLFAYLALPAFSKERSAILLRGAEVLGVKTDWPGWA
jgi:hypothetical protein